VAARVLVLAVAVLIAGLAAIDLHDDDGCQDRVVAVAVYGYSGKHPVSDGLVDEIIDRCRGSHLLALSSDALRTRRRYDQAFRLAREAIHREPDNHEGWVALSRTLRARGLDAAAERAMREVRRLNPRFGREPG
jgi:tetratricopeptide (TPR) repeat protein